MKIKFRFWTGEKMRYSGSICIFGDGCIYEKTEHKAQIIFVYKPSFIPLQFTGLHDKNGKEIYEGDILSDKWKVNVYKNKEGTYMVRFNHNQNGNKPKSLFKYLASREIAGTSERDNIVIGNIYEYQNLIKPSHERKHKI